MLKKLMCCLLAVFAALGCASCAKEPAYEKFNAYSFDVFDTMITIIGYAQSREVFDEVSGRALTRFKELHIIFDRYHEYEGVNNVCTLNRVAASAPVKVPEELMNLLKYTIDKQKELRGTVNIAMGSVLSLWHDARKSAEADPESAALPDMASLREAAEHASVDSLVINEEEGTVYFADDKLKLDLGAVAKGYATEIVAREMLSSEMPSFIINAGGNVRVGNPPRDGRKAWGVSIQNPYGGEAMETLFLSDTSVVTSGDYQRYYTVGETRLHHIISPETLMPATENRSVTIVTGDSALADILSTAVFILPYDEGRALIDGLDGVEALWMTAEGDIYSTDALFRMSLSGGATAK